MAERVIKRGGELVEPPSHKNIVDKDDLPGKATKPKTKITKSQRAELRLKFASRCAYCACELKETGWHADHVEPVRRDFDIVRAPQGSRVSHFVRSNGRVFHPERHELTTCIPHALTVTCLNRRIRLKDSENRLPTSPNALKPILSISAPPNDSG